LLVAGRWRRTASIAASGLLLLFFALMVHAYVRGEAIDCGCFGPGEAISPLTLLRDGGLLAGGLFLALMEWRQRSARADLGDRAHTTAASRQLV
jgi:hypothetical protein